MSYNIFSSKAPKMPSLLKGTECIKLLLSQASKNMREPLVPMLFPVLSAHVSGCEFLYPDLTLKELCGQMANLVADSGTNKSQLGYIVEAVCRSFRVHDEEQMQKLVAWQKQIKTRAANKEKPARPDVAFLFPPADATNPAFIQNAMGCEMQGGVTQYINMPEIEMADRLCGGHRQVSQMLRNIYDRERAGALRATAEGVTGNPVMRTNITISSTPIATKKFYKNELFNGTFGRMVFSYKPRTSRNGRIPRLGKYTDEFYAKLDVFIERLQVSKGRFIIKQLNKLIDRLAEDMAQMADLADDDMLWDISKRALVSAWKAGCVMWLLNNQTWTRAMGEMVEWLVYRDLWSKLQIFGDMLSTDKDTLADSQRKGPKNMLDNLPNVFTLTQLAALRKENGKSEEGAKIQVNNWKNRGFVDYDAPSDTYCKTEKYLKTNAR